MGSLRVLSTQIFRATGSSHLDVSFFSITKKVTENPDTRVQRTLGVRTAQGVTFVSVGQGGVSLYSKKQSAGALRLSAFQFLLKHP